MQLIKFRFFLDETGGQIWLRAQDKSEKSKELIKGVDPESEYNTVYFPQYSHNRVSYAVKHVMFQMNEKRRLSAKCSCGISLCTPFDHE